MVDFENVPYVVVKGLLPYIILAAIEKIGGGTVCKALRYIETEFNMRISPSTMYTTVYSLERQGYIQIVEGKIKYGVTDKSLVLLQDAVKTMKELFPKIEAFLEKY